MPDSRCHRGPHPQDADLFDSQWHTSLRGATADLSWLLSRGYAQAAALKLVGDRYRLRKRQREAVSRCACSDQALQRRERHRCDTAAGHDVDIDGFNVLLTLEVALSGGFVLLGRDGSYRDLASVHGSYRTVHETRPALELLANYCTARSAARWQFWLDRPVSNSGRLASLIRTVAGARQLDWRVTLVADPDSPLCGSNAIVASADSAIIDLAARWIPLARCVLEDAAVPLRLLDLA